MPSFAEFLRSGGASGRVPTCASGRVRVGNLLAMRNRRSMQAYLSDESRAGWDRVSLETGATLTALVESLGLDMRAGWRPSKRVVERARRIDRERFSRS